GGEAHVEAELHEGLGGGGGERGAGFGRGFGGCVTDHRASAGRDDGGGSLGCRACRGQSASRGGIWRSVRTRCQLATVCPGRADVGTPATLPARPRGIIPGGRWLAVGVELCLESGSFSGFRSWATDGAGRRRWSDKVWPARGLEGGCPLGS